MNPPESYTGWFRLTGRRRWQAVGTAPTLEDARELVRRHAEARGVKSFDSLVLPAGEDANRRRRVR